MSRRPPHRGAFHSHVVRAVVRLGVLGSGLAWLMVSIAAAPASAHVTITATSTTAGSTAVIRLEVPHGCAGSATAELAVRMPDAVTDLSVESTERWAAEPSEGAVVFRTEDPLPDAVRDEVAFSVRLPDEVGAELVFPVVQRCVEGESAWTEVAQDAASRDELDMPAPVIVVTAVEAGETEPSAVVDSQGSGGPMMTYGAVGMLTAGCLASAAVLLMRRRRG